MVLVIKNLTTIPTQFDLQEATTMTDEIINDLKTWYKNAIFKLPDDISYLDLPDLTEFTNIVIPTNLIELKIP